MQKAKLFVIPKSYKEDDLLAGTQELGMRLFFRRFLIVHLATNSDMDGFLGFTPPEPLATYGGYS